MPDNKAIIRRFEDAFAANDQAAIDELCSPDLVDHNPLPDQQPGLAGFKDAAAFYQTTFPQDGFELHQVIAEDDLVVTHWTVTATHKEEFLGVPATGKKVTAEGMNIYRLADGRVTDVWTQFDGLGVLAQIGGLPG